MVLNFLCAKLRHSTLHVPNSPLPGARLFWPTVAPMGCSKHVTGHATPLFCFQKLTARLRSLLFRTYLRQDMAFFDTPGHEAGALCARLALDTTLVQFMWGNAIGCIAHAAVTLTAGLTIAFVVSWKLALVTGSAVPATVIAGVINFRFMNGFESRRGGNLEQAGQVVNESIAGHRTVFAFNLQVLVPPSLQPVPATCDG